MLPLRFFAPTIAATCLATSAQAVQVYSFFEKNCKATAGALINVDEDAAHILAFDGSVHRVSLTKVQFVARYDLLENPFPRVVMSKDGPPLLTVASESSEGTFQAFATNFVEDLVLFLDTTGKIRVVEMDEIVAITSTPNPPEGITLKQRFVKLISPPGRGQCPAIAIGDGTESGAPDSAATQVMGDKLRIDSFFSRMRTGFQALESLRERTLFYARPILFDQKTRLGIIATRTNRYDAYDFAPFGWEEVPLYLEFGSGASYRFQSSTSLGNRTWRMTPQMRNFGAIRSEFKSHLLHGTFLGNFDGFTAGKPLFIERWDGTTRRQAWIESSFNHLTLLGADYGPWSMSYGYYFPSFAVGQRGEFRELTAAKASPVFHFGFLRTDWQLDLFLFNTNFNEELSNSVEDHFSADAGMRRDGTVRFYSTRFIPQSVRLTSTTARLDSIWLVSDSLKLGTDVAFTKTGYKETSLRRNTAISDPNDDFVPADGEAVDLSGTTTSNIVRQQLWANKTFVHMDLGQWVALSAEAISEYATNEGSLGDGENLKKSDFIKTYVVVMELLL